MTTIKSYTDLQQSKKLAEILPLESADMWHQHVGFSIKDGSERRCSLLVACKFT